MREIRTSGSEGGGIETNRRSLPLSLHGEQNYLIFLPGLRCLLGLCHSGHIWKLPVSQFRTPLLSILSDTTLSLLTVAFGSTMPRSRAVHSSSACRFSFR